MKQGNDSTICVQRETTTTDLNKNGWKEQKSRGGILESSRERKKDKERTSFNERD